MEIPARENVEILAKKKKKKITSSPQRRRLLHFVPFPGLRSSGDKVFGTSGHCDLSPPPSPPLSFLGEQQAHLLRQMLIFQNPKKS